MKRGRFFLVVFVEQQGLKCYRKRKSNLNIKLWHWHANHTVIIDVRRSSFGIRSVLKPLPPYVRWQLYEKHHLKPHVTSLGLFISITWWYPLWNERYSVLHTTILFVYVEIDVSQYLLLTCASLGNPHFFLLKNLGNSTHLLLVFSILFYTSFLLFGALALSFTLINSFA